MLRHDVRFTVRLLAAHPSFSVGTIGVLAVAIGLTAAVFALADPYVLRGLPYPNPDRLISVEVRRKPLAGPSMFRTLSGPAITDLERRRDLFEGMALYRHSGSIRGRLNGMAVALRSVTCTNTLLEILGVPGIPAADKEFALLTPAAAARLSLSPSFQVAGLVKDDGTFLPMVGVLPGSFVFPSNHHVFPIDVVLVRAAEVSELTSGTAIARLRSGVSLSAARDAITRLTPSVSGLQATVQPLAIFMAGKNRMLSWGALVAAGLIFLVAAANVANLVLAHAFARSGEVAIRSALGAARADFVRLMFVESGLICLAAIGGGLVIAGLALPFASRLAPIEYLALGAPRLTGRVALIAIASGSVFFVLGSLSQWAGWHMSHGRDFGPLRHVEARKARNVRLLSTTAQATLAMILITGGAFLTRSYLNLTSQDPGMDSDVLVATVSYPDDLVGSRLGQVIEATVDRLRRLGRVDRAAAAIGPILDRTVVMGGFFVGGTGIAITPFQVSTDYFETLGARVVSGRSLLAIDRGRTGVVVNERLAQLAWPNAQVVGQRVGAFGEGEVVGVIQDTFSLALDTLPTSAAYTLIDKPSGCRGDCNSVNYVVRARPGVSTRELFASISDEIRAAGESGIMTQLNSVGDRLSGSVKDRSFATIVLVLFAVTSLVVCALGLAGLTAFVVASRTRELAIRSCLGAATGHLLRTVLVQAAGSTVAGIVIGVLAGALMSRILTDFLYGIVPGDPITLSWSVLVLLAAATGASLVPALRALRVAPALAMRAE